MCHNQRTLASEEEFTIEEPSENQALVGEGQNRGRSGKFFVITMSLINEAGWFGVHNYYAYASAGVTVSPREWGGNKEEIRSLSYIMQTSFHVSASFTLILYLKFIFTDSNDKVYP